MGSIASRNQTHSRQNDCIKMHNSQSIIKSLKPLHTDGARWVLVAGITVIAISTIIGMYSLCQPKPTLIVSLVMAIIFLIIGIVLVVTSVWLHVKGAEWKVALSSDGVGMYIETKSGNIYKQSLKEWDTISDVVMIEGTHDSPGGISIRGNSGKQLFISSDSFDTITLFQRINAHRTARIKKDQPHTQSEVN